MSLNPTGIEWCTHTWNPMFGCKHTVKECACADHCYANNVATTRLKANFREPIAHASRMFNVTPGQKPRVIFVGSMTDMMGEWWASAQISAVIDRCAQCPQHIFMWLTKKPTKYADFKFPDNCWLGTSVTGKNDIDRPLQLLKSCLNTTFISHEPIMGEWIPEYSHHWIVAGCMTKGDGWPDPSYPVDLELLRKISRHHTMLIKRPLSKDPADKQFPPEIEAIMRLHGHKDG